MQTGNPLRMLVLLLGSLCVSACNGTGFGTWLSGDGALLEDGPAARMTPAAIAQTIQKQTPLLYNFAILASIPIKPASDVASQSVALAALQPNSWPLITHAGEDYIDTQCHEYVSALYNLDRSRRTALANLNTIQSATVGIMGITQVAQTAIGITGISMGLAGQLFNTTVSSVLYQLPPTAVARVIDAQRTLYRNDENDASFWANITSESAAIKRLADYILYCTPVTIEAKISAILSSTSADTATNQLISKPPPNQNPQQQPPPPPPPIQAPGPVVPQPFVPPMPAPQGPPVAAPQAPPAAAPQAPPAAAPQAPPAAAPQAPPVITPQAPIVLPPTGAVIGTTSMTQDQTRDLANAAIDLSQLLKLPPRHPPTLAQVAALYELYIVAPNANLPASTAARLHGILKDNPAIELPNDQLNLRPNKKQAEVVGVLTHWNAHGSLARAAEAIAK